MEKSIWQAGDRFCNHQPICVWSMKSKKADWQKHEKPKRRTGSSGWKLASLPPLTRPVSVLPAKDFSAKYFVFVAKCRIWHTADSGWWAHRSKINYNSTFCWNKSQSSIFFNQPVQFDFEPAIRLNGLDRGFQDKGSRHVTDLRSSVFAPTLNQIQFESLQQFEENWRIIDCKQGNTQGWEIQLPTTGISFHLLYIKVLM